MSGVTEEEKIFDEDDEVDRDLYEHKMIRFHRCPKCKAIYKFERPKGNKCTSCNYKGNTWQTRKPSFLFTVVNVISVIFGIAVWFGFSAIEHFMKPVTQGVVGAVLAAVSIKLVSDLLQKLVFFIYGGTVFFLGREISRAGRRRQD